MTFTSEKKISALTLPGVVGLLILAYDYGSPGLAQIPNEWNLFIGRFLFTACFLGGAVTSVLALVALKSHWDKLDQIFKTMLMVLNLCWLAAVIFIALKLHGAAWHH